MCLTISASGTLTGAWCRGWICSGQLLHQWTGNSGCPLCVREFDPADLGLGRDMCGTHRNPTGVILGGCGARDDSLGHEMDEAPAVIIPGDGRLGRQNSELAVGAEHFGSGST